VPQCYFISQSVVAIIMLIL